MILQKSNQGRRRGSLPCFVNQAQSTEQREGEDCYLRENPDFHGKSVTVNGTSMVLHAQKKAPPLPQSAGLRIASTLQSSFLFSNAKT